MRAAKLGHGDGYGVHVRHPVHGVAANGEHLGVADQERSDELDVRAGRVVPWRDAVDAAEVEQVAAGPQRAVVGERAVRERAGPRDGDRAVVVDDELAGLLAQAVDVGVGARRGKPDAVRLAWRSRRARAW